MNENTEEVVSPTTDTPVVTEEATMPSDAQEKIDSEVDNNAPTVDAVEDTEEAVADEDLTEDNEAATANAVE